MVWNGEAIDWDTEFGRRPIEDIYNDTLIEYKEQARKELCQELGYEPLLKYSMPYEYRYRQSLQAYNEKRITKDGLDSSLRLQARVINEDVKHNEPDLKELTLKYENKSN